MHLKKCNGKTFMSMLFLCLVDLLCECACVSGFSADGCVSPSFRPSFLSKLM